MGDEIIQLPSVNGAATGQGARSDPVIQPPADESSLVSSADDPLVGVLVSNAMLHPEEFGGPSASFAPAIAKRIALDATASRFELARERKAREKAEATVADLRERCARLEGRLNALEKPWAERVRTAVGGGLMGASFKIADFHSGLANFAFFMGVVLICVPLFQYLSDRSSPPKA